MARKKGRRTRRSVARHISAPGAMPGAFVIDPDAPRPRITVLAYGPDGSEEAGLERPEQIRPYLERWPVTWVHVDGLGDAETLHGIAQVFEMHRLALEDIVHVSQRPKIEHHDDDLFVVARMVQPPPPPTDGPTPTLETEQLSLYVTDRAVVTFQERAGDYLEPVRTRIRKASGRIRARRSDYLAYALLDTVVDHYFPALERYAGQIDAVEEQLLRDATIDPTPAIQRIKYDLLTLHGVLRAQRDATIALQRGDVPLIAEDTQPYLRDLHDHTLQLVEAVETQRELTSGLLDLHVAMVSMRTNEIMRVLTIFAAIFIPLTFIAGLYGMNFRGDVSPLNMPELEWSYGYPFALGLMTALALGMLFFFRRKGWIGGRRGPR